MNLHYLKQFCIDKSAEFPKLKSEILDFFFLAKEEIEDGESESHEVELAISSIKQLVEENQ